jgi:hypothetical protein
MRENCSINFNIGGFRGTQSEPFVNLEVPDHEKMSFRPSKWPPKFRTQKTTKNSKLPTNYFEPVGIVGWPLISTWIRGL